VRARAAVLALALVALGALITTGCEPSGVPIVPGAAPQVACQGVPDKVCKEAFDTVVSDGRGAIAQFVVRCSRPPCTLLNGEAEILIVFADGRRESSSYGWASEPAAPQPIPVITPPPLVVEPVCDGVPAPRCIEMATGGLDGDTAGAVGKITVRCSAVCTPTSGHGQNLYEFVDGRPEVTTDWAYGGGGWAPAGELAVVG